MQFGRDYGRVVVAAAAVVKVGYTNDDAEKRGGNGECIESEFSGDCGARRPVAGTWLFIPADVRADVPRHSPVATSSRSRRSCHIRCFVISQCQRRVGQQSGSDSLDESRLFCHFVG